ncbi:hypothetical protein VUR80DRAFT_6053 [Thermomyces stellatus]
MIDMIVEASKAVEDEPDAGDQAQTPAGLLDALPMDYGFFYWGLNQCQPGEFSEALADAFMDYGIQFDPSSSGPGSSRDDSIMATIASILAELDSFYASLESRNRLPSGEYHFDVATAHEVLTPANMRTHIAAYFRFTNPYYPTVHRPTFEIETAPPVLLIALFLCGSLYRGDKDRDYRGLYNLAEEYAFTKLGMAVERHAAHGAVAAKDAVAVLQAATLIHSLQWIINCASSRRRNWDLRLPALVAAVRSLGYTRLRHAEQNREGYLDWEKFIQLETCIRTGIHVVQSDWLQAGMYHSPHHTTIYELTGDIPCIRSLWEASDAAEFQSIVQSKGVEILHRPYSVRSCVEDLMRENFSVSHLVSFRRLTIADLGLILLALFAVVSSARFSCTLRALAPTAMRATCRWQDFWKAAVSKVDEGELEFSGLAKYSAEMCWLARKNIELAVTGKEDLGYLRDVAHESLEEVHTLIRELQREEGETSSERG